MRDIKFRGICKSTGKIVYGDLIHSALTAGSKVVEVGIAEKGCYPVEVKPETVGQFTGLHDKNGREIYEGDLIQLMDNKTGFMTVEFINAYVGGWVLTFKDSDPLSLGARQAGELLIVGNIHENPELLESAK